MHKPPSQSLQTEQQKYNGRKEGRNLEGILEGRKEGILEGRKEYWKEGTHRIRYTLLNRSTRCCYLVGLFVFVSMYVSQSVEIGEKTKRKGTTSQHRNRNCNCNGCCVHAYKCVFV